MLRNDVRNRKFLSFFARCLPLLLLTLCLAAGPLPAYASSSSSSGGSSQIDAVLVLDVSNSMKTSDKNGIASEAMKMFIDMLSTKGDKVGVVAYTDAVQREKALLTINSASDKQDLKDFIGGLDKGAYTDIAVGVGEAVKVLQNGSDPSHEPMIVLLADGNNDLNEATGRTQSESDQELNAAVETAKKNGYPIYTIGLNADGKLNKTSLAKLSDQTGGKAFATDSPDDLPGILSEIFADHLKLKVVPIQSMTASGEYQEVTVNVPNASVLEANISIMSSRPVTAKLTDPSGASVAIPSNQVLLSKSATYSLLKLLTPQEGDWKLQIKGVPKDKIDINLIFNYDLELKLDALPSKTYKKGDTIGIAASLFTGGTRVTEAELYNNMKAVLLATDLDTGKTEELPLNHDSGQFKGEFKVKDSHNYELKVRAEESSFYRESNTVQVQAGGSATGAPAGGGTAESGNEAQAAGGLSWTLILIIAGALLVLAAAAVIWILWRKASRGFVGQLVIEVLDGNTGEKTYPQYKKLNGFRGRFNLHQLLQLAPELKESENLVFTPGNNDRLLLRGGDGIAVEKSGRAVDAARGLEMKSGDRVSIPLHSVDKTIMLEYLV